MRRRGSILAEVVISIMIFLIAIVALSGSILLSLRMTVDSGKVMQREQNVMNDCDAYLLKRSLTGSGAPGSSISSCDMAKTGQTLALGGEGSGGRAITYDLYKFYAADKKGSEIYVIQRKP